jgi:hypothetical protein
LNRTCCHILIFALAILAGFSAAAQNDSQPAYSKGTHHMYFYADFDMNSAGLTNRFIGDLYYGRTIPYSLRSNISHNLGDKDLAGYRLDAGLYYFFSPNDFKKKFGYYIGVEEHSMMELSFRKSFFDLVFFGNEDYKDQFVKFDNMKLNIMDWQQLKFGVFKAIHKNDRVHQLGFGLAFNKGQRHMCVDLHKGSFFTQKDAEYVALDVDMDVYHTDSANNSITDVNGYGVSLDLSYNYTDKHENEFQLRVSNIGYIRWDKVPDNFTRDTTFKFEGFNVDLLSLNSPVFDSTTVDSITGAIYGSNRKQGYSVRLPLDIDAIYTYHFPPGNLSLTAEFRYRFYSLYRAYFEVKPGYSWLIKCAKKKTGEQKATGRISIGIFPMICYGGYGLYNAGLDISMNFRQKLLIGIGTRTLNSMMAPSSSAGLSANFTLYKMF